MPDFGTMQMNPDSSAFINLNPDRDTSVKIGLREIINLVPVVKQTGAIYHSYNNELAMLTGEQVLQEMGAVIREEFDIDVIARQEWTENAGKILELFASYSRKKDSEFDIKLPVVTISAVQFQARAFESLVPSNDLIVKLLPAGDESVNRAERVQKFMNWQLLYKMRDFIPGVDEILMHTPLLGSCFKKTYYSFTQKRPISLPISARDITYAYTMGNFQQSPRKTHTLYLTKSELRRGVQLGVYDPIAWDLGPGDLTYFPEMNRLAQMKDQVQGVVRPWSLTDIPRMVIEQHREWDLNGDGVGEAYAITVDYQTRQVLRITARSFEDAFGNEVNLDHFTHFYFLPNPEGAYAFGLGTLLLGLNQGMNKILNEILEAGELANLLGGFVSKRSGVKKGDIKFKMGEWKEVDAYVDDIQKALYTFDFKGPNQTLYATLGLLYEYAKMVASVSETMTGAMPASDTPAQTILALLEEGKKVYSAIYKRHHTAFTEEIRKIFTLNSIFLTEQEYFHALGAEGYPVGPKEIVGRSDFIGEDDLVPVSDPNILSRAEKVLVAQQILADVRSNPLTTGDPNANYAATKRYYEALGARNLNEILPPPQKPQELSPQEENAKMMTEVPAQVTPEQDHAEHVRVHDDFTNSPIYGPQLTPNARNVMERHRMEHMGAHYLSMNPRGAVGGGNV